MQCESVCVESKPHAWVKGAHGVTCAQARSEVNRLIKMEYLALQLTVQQMLLFTLLFIKGFSMQQLNIIHSLVLNNEPSLN